MNPIQACAERLGSKWALPPEAVSKAEEIISAHSKSRGADECIRLALSLSRRTPPKFPLQYLRRSLHSLKPYRPIDPPMPWALDEDGGEDGCVLEDAADKPDCIIRLEETIDQISAVYEKHPDPSASQVIAELEIERDRILEAWEEGADVEKMVDCIIELEEESREHQAEYRDSLPDWRTCPHTTEW